MQALDAKTQYRNSFHCSARIFSEEGFLTYWKGIGPRSARTVVSLLKFFRFSFSVDFFSSKLELKNF